MCGTGLVHVRLVEFGLEFVVDEVGIVCYFKPVTQGFLGASDVDMSAVDVSHHLLYAVFNGERSSLIVTFFVVVLRDGVLSYMFCELIAEVLNFGDSVIDGFFFIHLTSP